jgi:hypothetical protein
MITTSNIVEKIVLSSPFIEEGLAQGLINLSALARKIKPQIEKSLMKPVSDLAVVMALKRLSNKIEMKSREPLNLLKKMGDITVKSNLTEYTFAHSNTLFEKVRELFLRIESQRDKFITITQGVFEVTLIVSSNLTSDIDTIFQDEKLFVKIRNLSAVTIKLPSEAIGTPGIHHAILRKLAWRNINITEVVSTYTEFIIILSTDLITSAFVSLNELFKE